METSLSQKKKEGRKYQPKPNRRRNQNQKIPSSRNQQKLDSKPMEVMYIRVTGGKKVLKQILSLKRNRSGKK